MLQGRVRVILIAKNFFIDGASSTIFSETIFLSYVRKSSLVLRQKQLFTKFTFQGELFSLLIGRTLPPEPPIWPNILTNQRSNCWNKPEKSSHHPCKCVSSLLLLSWNREQIWRSNLSNLRFEGKIRLKLPLERLLKVIKTPLSDSFRLSNGLLIRPQRPWPTMDIWA